MGLMGDFDLAKAAYQAIPKVLEHIPFSLQLIAKYV